MAEHALEYVGSRLGDHRGGSRRRRGRPDAPRTSWPSAASRSPSTRRATRPGGKARSSVPGSGTGGRADLPGRARLPLLPRLLPPPAGHDGADPVGRRTASDRLVGAERILLAQGGRRATSSSRRRTRPSRSTTSPCWPASCSTRPRRLGVPRGRRRVLRRAAAHAAHQLRRAPLRAVGAARAGGTSCEADQRSPGVPEVPRRRAHAHARGRPRDAR